MFRLLTRLGSPATLPSRLALMRPRLLSSAAPATRSVAGGTVDVRSVAGSSNQVGRWSLRLAHDNTFLSYHRNAIIATVAGCALLKYRVDEGKPPLAGAGLLLMGGLYMYVGSGLYVWQVVKLRGELRLGRKSVTWAVFNAGWPLAIWSVSVCDLTLP